MQVLYNGTLGKTIIAFASLLGISFLIKTIYEIHRLINFDYNFVGYKFKEIDEKYIYIDIKVKVINTSALEANVLGYSIDVFLNDKFVAKLISKEKQIIKKKGYSSLLLPLKIDHIKSLGAISSKIISYLSQQELDKVFLTFKGYFLVKAIGTEYKAKIDEKMSLAEIQEEYS